MNTSSNNSTKLALLAQLMASVALAGTKKKRRHRKASTFSSEGRRPDQARFDP